MENLRPTPQTSSHAYTNLTYFAYNSFTKKVKEYFLPGLKTNTEQLSNLINELNLSIYVKKKMISELVVFLGKAKNYSQKSVRTGTLLTNHLIKIVPQQERSDEIISTIKKITLLINSLQDKDHDDNNIKLFLDSQEKKLEQLLLDNYNRLSNASHLSDEETYELGEIYQLGIGIPSDLNKAIKYFEEVKGSKFSDALYQLGMIHRRQKTLDLALNYLKKSSNLGNIKAYIELGIIYYYGGDSLDKNIAIAKENFEKAIIHNNPLAIYNLALALLHNPTNTKDGQYAFELLERNVNLNNDTNSKYVLAHIYRDGKIVTKDLSEAIKYLTEAAYEGHNDAILDLAVFYTKYDTKQDTLEAIFWFEQIINKPNISSTVIIRLIVCYIKINNPKELKVAVMFCNKLINNEQENRHIQILATGCLAIITAKEEDIKNFHRSVLILDSNKELQILVRIIWVTMLEKHSSTIIELYSITYNTLPDPIRSTFPQCAISHQKFKNDDSVVALQENDGKVSCVLLLKSYEEYLAHCKSSDKYFISNPLTKTLIMFYKL